MLPARDSWPVNTAHVSSFVLISILRGQPRTPPSGNNLGVLDSHLKQGNALFTVNSLTPFSVPNTDPVNGI